MYLIKSHRLEIFSYWIECAQAVIKSVTKISIFKASMMNEMKDQSDDVEVEKVDSLIDKG